jgi:threonine synthase
VLEVRWDYPALLKTGRFAGDTFDIHELLPVERIFFPPIPVGNTPLWCPDNLRMRTGLPNLFVKDDGLNPTGSFKDRASYLAAAFARRHRIARVAVASTGNAASSMAGVGAAAGLEVKIFMPKSAPRAKTVQCLQYGAEVVSVDGNYDLAYDTSLDYCRTHKDVLSRNTAQQPLTIEGKKTVSLEIYKQLGTAPDRLYVSAGDGVILAGVYRGFEDLVALGLVSRVPEIVAVQAEGSAAISAALDAGDFYGPIASRTVADSIAVDVPRNGYHALGKLKRHGGRVVVVSDEEILDAQRLLASASGLFTEPAGAAAFAGFLKDRSGLDPHHRVVVLVTGNGLKDIDSALRGLDRPRPKL